MFKMAKKILAIDGKSGAGPSGGHASALDAPRNNSSGRQDADNGGGGGKQRGGPKENSSGANPQQQAPVPLHKSINRPPMSTEELNDFSKLEDDPRLPLNVRQIFKITKSWKAIARATSKTGTVMFLNLFEQNKDLFYLFDRFQHLKGKELHDSMELREHAATVMSTLDQSINLLSDYDNFVAYLHSIGELHRKVPEFKREHFWKIEQPFMTAVKQTLDERCNETIEQIYKIAIKLIIETIAEGYGRDGQTSAPTNPTTLAPSSGSSGPGGAGGFGAAPPSGADGGKTETGSTGGASGQPQRRQGYGAGAGTGRQQAAAESCYATGSGAPRSDAAGSLLSLSSRANGTTITTTTEAETETETERRAKKKTALSRCSLQPSSPPSSSSKTTMAPSDRDLLERRHANDADRGQEEPPSSDDAGKTAAVLATASGESAGLAAADGGANYCSDPSRCSALLRRRPQQQPPDSSEQHSAGPSGCGRGGNRTLFALSQVVGVAAAEAAAVNATCAVAKTAAASVATATTAPTDDATATAATATATAAAELMMMLMSGNGGGGGDVGGSNGRDNGTGVAERAKPFRPAASGHGDSGGADDECARLSLGPVGDDHDHGTGSGRTVAATAAEQCLRMRSHHAKSDADANAAPNDGAANKTPRPSSSAGAIGAVFCRSRRLVFSDKEHTRTNSSSGSGSSPSNWDSNSDTGTTVLRSARGTCDAAAEIAAEAQIDRRADGRDNDNNNSNLTDLGTCLHGDHGPGKHADSTAAAEANRRHCVSTSAQQHTVRYKIQTTLNTQGRSLRKRLAALTSRLLRDAASVVGYRSVGTGLCAGVGADRERQTSTATFTSSDRCPYAAALHNVNWGTNKCRQQSASGKRQQQQKSNCYLSGESGQVGAGAGAGAGAVAMAAPLWPAARAGGATAAAGGPSVAAVGVAQPTAAVTFTGATADAGAVGEEWVRAQVRQSRQRIRVPSSGLEASVAAMSIEGRLQQAAESSMCRDGRGLGGDKDVGGGEAAAVTETAAPTTIMDRSNMKVAVNGSVAATAAAAAADASRRTNIVAVAAAESECPCSREEQVEKNTRRGYYSCVRDAAGAGARADVGGANTAAAAAVANAGASSRRIRSRNRLVLAEWFDRLSSKLRPRSRSRQAQAAGAVTGCATSMRSANKTTTTTKMTDTKPGSNQPISTPPAAPARYETAAAKTGASAAAKTTSSTETIAAARVEMSSKKQKQKQKQRKQEKGRNKVAAMNLSADIGELVELIKMIVIAVMRHRAARSRAEQELQLDSAVAAERSDIASQLSPLFSESFCRENSPDR